jgi:hypothetical protein
MSLLVILASLSLPSVKNMYADERGKAAADAVRTGWALARSHAIEEGRPYRFAFQPTKGSYRVAPDDPAYWSGDGGTGDSTRPPFILEDTLPENIRFMQGDDTSGGDSSGASGDDGQWSSACTFLPDGSALEDVSVTLQVPDSRPVLLRLRSLTGAVSMSTPDAETGQP